MAKTLQIKRGNEVNLPSLSPGEFGLCLDSQELYIGGSTKNIKVTRGCNKNLLDNWYFANPVNQRGQTQYSGYGYTIDRWITDGTVTINEGISSTQPFYQVVEDKVIEALLGKVVTLSAMDAGNLVSCTYKFPDSIPGDYVMLNKLYGDEILQVFLCSGDKSQLFRFGAGVNKILAVKAEIGYAQTLARQDESGKWILNEIPDFGEELLKCCMNMADRGDAYANKIVIHTGNMEELLGVVPATLE